MGSTLKKKRDKQRQSNNERSGHKSATASTTDNNDVIGSKKHEQHLPFSLQQAILNVFSNAFHLLIQDTARLTQVTQEVKTHLYNRDFTKAFDKPEYLQAYALRWSATRALGYTDIFLKPERKEWFVSWKDSHTLKRLNHESKGNLAPIRKNERVDSNDQLRTTSLTKPLAEVDQPGLHSKKDPSDDLQCHKKDSNLQVADIQDISTIADKELSTTSQQISERDVQHGSPDELGDTDHNSFFTEVICVGGGAGAEVIALASAFHTLTDSADHDQDRATSYSDRDHMRRPDMRRLHITAIDIADWKEPLQRLTKSLTLPPSLSAHASEAVRKQNKAMLRDEEQIKVSFYQFDVLNWKDRDDSDTAISPKDEAYRDLPFCETIARTNLITIMFTLNELFSISISRTTAFLLRLTDSTRKGSRLVVVDSPGSYSEISLGSKSTDEVETQNQKKRYPMKWLLDHALLNVSATDGIVKWHKEENEDSVWFRISQQGIGTDRLRYPVDLENMRYQIHVYRRL